MFRYKIESQLGSGAQGVVLKARVLSRPPLWDSRLDGGCSPEFVALKRMGVASSGFAAAKFGIGVPCIREVMALRELTGSRFVIRMLDIFAFSGMLYVALPLMCGDLEQVIRARSVVLSTAHCKAYLRMILSAVEYCHSHYEMHRDLKPANCLLASDGRVVVSDFGLARDFGNTERLVSAGACTLWYRSPELLFGSVHYTWQLDLWSIGCIFAELMLRMPLFPGSNELDTLARIFTLFGCLSPDKQTTVSAVPADFVDAVEGVSALPRSSRKAKRQSPHSSQWCDFALLPKFRRFKERPPIDLNSVFVAASKNAIHLFSKFCQLDPNKRISAKAALAHEYFTESPQPSALSQLPLPNKDF